MSTSPPKDLEWGDELVFSRDGEPISPEARALMGVEPLAPPPGKRWVDVFDVELDYWALVDGYLARHEHRKLAVAGAYWKKRVELLERLLGFSLEDAGAPTAERITEELRGAALNAIRRHACIVSPFCAYLEGSPPTVVGEIEKRHRPTFETVNRDLRRACRELVAEIVRTLDPGIVERRICRSQLFDLGLAWWEPDALLEGW